MPRPALPRCTCDHAHCHSSSRSVNREQVCGNDGAKLFPVATGDGWDWRCYACAHGPAECGLDGCRTCAGRALVVLP